MKKVLILASGNGSNAENISKFLKKIDSGNEIKVLCNVKNAGVFKKITNLKIPCMLFDIDNNTYLIKECQNFKPDLIVLAGYLKKIPTNLIENFKKKIINIHPSLLPKYGGKGMYGDNVHKAVLKSKERFTGISIHFVDEIYDNGEVIFQKSCKIDENETVLTLREKIRVLEYHFFPKVIEKTVLNYEH